MAAAQRLSETTLRILENIERLRGERQVSGPTVAAAAGISATTWYRRLAAPGQFTVDELAGVAEALRCSLADLVS